RAVAAWAGGGDPVLGRGERRAALGLVVIDLGQQDRQLVLRDGDEAAGVAVDDRDRAAPVALARDQPVARAGGGRCGGAGLGGEPADDRVERLAVGHAVKARVGVDE